MRSAHATASRAVPSRPPFTTTSQAGGSSGGSARRRASMATTTACDPNRRAQRRTRSGVATAAVLSDTLSAPARSTSRISLTVRTPPPTVRGTKARRAVRSTISRSVARPSGAAVMSRKTISSAPSRAYRSASSGGSPSSTRSTKRVPLTTRPSATSRQGITRTASIRPRSRRPSRRANGSGEVRRRSARPGAIARRQRHEAGEEPEPVGAAPLRVELDAGEAAARDGADEVGAVVGHGEGDRPGLRARRPRREGVDEVERGPGGDAREERVVPGPAHGVPPDVGQARRVHAAGPSGPAGSRA